MKAKLVVIDTNVFIGAILSPQGTPAKVIKQVITNSRIVFSDETYEEFHSRLWLPKFDAYISREKRRLVLIDFSNIAEWIEISGTLKYCRDMDDDKFLEVAIKANADTLISGDRDLTDLKNIEGIQIMTPLEYLTMLDS